MSTIDDILKKIKKAKSIVILTHENPDGDAIGSSLAMYTQIKSMKKNVDLIIPSYPKIFNVLADISEAKKEGKEEPYDLAISVDCATIKLLNGWSSYFENSNFKIAIDHHSTNDMFGDFNYVDLSSPACAQVIYMMFKHYGWKITPEIGTDLMTGIITDTGGFQYSGVSKETFEIASELLSKGVNISKIYKQVMETKTMANFKLRKIALDRMEFLEDGKITFTYITKEDEKDTNAETGDYEGIVNEGRAIEGVEVSIFLHEMNNGFKASLRANNYVNVSDVCLMFGGGGHIKAAGATMQGTPKQIKDKLVKEIKLQLK